MEVVVLASAYKVEKALQQLINNIGNKVAKDTAIEIAEELNKAYISVIKGFYDDYTPTSYKRGYNLYFASPMYGKNRQKSNVVKRVTGGYLVEFNISGENIEGSPYVDWQISDNTGGASSGYKYQLDTVPASNSKVLFQTFNLGMHGKITPFSPNMPHKTVPSPKKEMDNRFKIIKSSVRGTISKYMDKYVRMYK